MPVPPNRLPTLTVLHPYKEQLAAQSKQTWDAGSGFVLQSIDDEFLAALKSEERNLDPAPCRLFLGSTIWAPEQLQMELGDHHAWVPMQVENFDAPRLLAVGGEDNTDVDVTKETHAMWACLMRSLGGEFEDLASMPFLPTDAMDDVRAQIRYCQHPEI